MTNAWKTPVELVTELKQKAEMYDFDSNDMKQSLAKLCVDYVCLLIDSFPGDLWRTKVQDAFEPMATILKHTYVYMNLLWKETRVGVKNRTIPFAPVLPCMTNDDFERLIWMCFKFSRIQISHDKRLFRYEEVQDNNPNRSLLCIHPTYRIYREQVMRTKSNKLRDSFKEWKPMTSSYSHRFQTITELLTALMFGMQTEVGMILIAEQSQVQKKNGFHYVAVEVGVANRMKLTLVPINTLINPLRNPYYFSACYDVERLMLQRKK